MREILGPNPCMIVAHPDDETLWGGGLIATYNDLDWTVACCSIPLADPIRAWLLHDATAVLGVKTTKLMPYQEVRGERLWHLPGMRGYSCYVTHGEAGEYGHPHHIQIHKHVVKTSDAPVLGFNVLGGQHKVKLGEEAGKLKLEALKQYRHVLPYEGVEMPKWEALLQRYKQLDFAIEGYDEYTA